MTEPEFTITCVATDRTRPLATGEVAVRGARLRFVFDEPESIFRTALNEARFPLTELSMSSHVVTTARSDANYVAVPVFLSRAFRHSAIFVRSDAGIASLADLKGAAIGLPEYQQTAANVGARHDERRRRRGVRRHLARRRARPPGSGEADRLDLPPDHPRPRSLRGGDARRHAARGATRRNRVAARPGERPARDTRIRRLYADPRIAEMAYYRDTGFFPIMHALAVRKDVAEAYPWLPASLFAAYTEAKRRVLEELAMSNVLRVSLPWIGHDHASAMHVTGGDLGPMASRATGRRSRAMTRYMSADGTASRKVDPEELFHPSTLALVQ